MWVGVFVLQYKSVSNTKSTAYFVLTLLLA